MEIRQLFLCMGRPKNPTLSSNGLHYGSEQSENGTSKMTLSHELGSERASERANERSGARKRSEQCGANE